MSHVSQKRIVIVGGSSRERDLRPWEKRGDPCYLVGVRTVAVV